MQKALIKSYRKAHEHMCNGRYNKAAKLFAKCLTHNMHPDERISLLVSYSIAVMDQSPDKAIMMVTDAIALNEKEQERYHEAQASAYLSGIDLGKIIPWQDQEGYLHYLRAHIRAVHKDYATAIEDYDHAEKAGYLEYELYRKRAAAFFFTEDYKKAEEDYSKALSIKENPSLYHGRAICCLNLNQHAEAQSDLERCLEECDDELKELCEPHLKIIKPYNMVVEALLNDPDTEWRFEDCVLKGPVDVKIEMYKEKYLVTIIAEHDQDIVDKVKTDNSKMTGLSPGDKTHYEYTVMPSETGDLEQDIENRGIALIELIDLAVKHFTEKNKKAEEN